MTPTEAVTAFNACIGARDIDGLAARMTQDHVFIDTAGHAVRGRDACVAAWTGFFAAFPDYQNVFEQIIERGDSTVIVGHSICSDPRLAGRAIWSAKTDDARIAEWRVWEDTPANRAALGLN